MNQLDIHTITATLEGLEETIIFKLIDRAQFKANPLIYEAGKSDFEGTEGKESLFDLRLQYQERMDAQFGRFCVPEERPFCTNLPAPRRRVTIPPTGLRITDYNRVNLTAEIKKMYCIVLPTLCISGDDGQYGSSVEHDVYALQALSRRIHYGALYVAECKYQSNPGSYRTLIKEKDMDKLLPLLTREQVEEKILARVQKKVEQAQAGINTDVRRIVDPECILSIYREYIIPITKKGEILYLLHREREHDT